MLKLIVGDSLPAIQRSLSLPAMPTAGKPAGGGVERQAGVECNFTTSFYRLHINVIGFLLFF